MKILGKLTMLIPIKRVPKDELETNRNEVRLFCKLFKHLCSINSLIYTKEYDYLTNLKLQKQKLLGISSVMQEKISFECLGCFSQFSFPTMMKGDPSLVPRGLAL